MIRLAISQAAFGAIAATLPLGSVGYENAPNERGERLTWLDRAVDTPALAARPRESFSDVCGWPRKASSRASGRSPIVEKGRFHVPLSGRE